MIDIHSHLLYGVDDGSKNIDYSVRVIKKLKEVGITDIILTPHYINYSSYVSPKKDNITLLNNLKKELKNNNVDVNLYLGNEIYIDKDIEALLKQNIISSLNNSKYVLIELPMSGEYEDYYDIFLDLINKGYKVVLAHPERYLAFQKDFKKILELKSIGVLFQCNAESILKKYGKKAKKTIKKMLKKDLVTFFGTDIHHDRSNYDFIELSKKKTRKYVKDEKLNDLFINNAKKIIDEK